MDKTYPLLDPISEGRPCYMCYPPHKAISMWISHVNDMGTPVCSVCIDRLNGFILENQEHNLPPKPESVVDFGYSSW